MSVFVFPAPGSTAFPPSGGGADATTASNLGAGEGLYATKVGDDLRFKSITAGTNITLTPSGTELQISASGGSFSWATPIDSDITVDADSTWSLGANAGQLYAVHSQQVLGDSNLDLVSQASSLNLYASSTNSGGVEIFDWDFAAAIPLRFWDNDASNYVALKGPGVVATNVTWTLPATDGTSGQALVTNGTGTLSWSTPSGITWSTPVNANIVPDSTANTRTLGTTSSLFNTLHTTNVNNPSKLNLQTASSNRIIIDSTGKVSFNSPEFGFRYNFGLFDECIMLGGITTGTQSVGVSFLHSGAYGFGLRTTRNETSLLYLEDASLSANPSTWYGGSAAHFIVRNGAIGVSRTGTPIAALDAAGATGSLSSIIVPKDTTANRPSPVEGMIRYNTTDSKLETYEGGVWKRPVVSAGATGSRPASPYAGQSYFDTTLGIPIWYSGAAWVDATGASV